MATLGVLFIAVASPTTASSGGENKIYTKVDNREIFMRAIEIYANRDQVKQQVLCVTVDDLPTIQAKYSAHLGFQGVSVTAGGPDWFGVVARGLEKLKPEIDTVIIHDAACPAVPYTVLDAMEAALAKGGVDAVVPTLPIGGHIAKVANGILNASVTGSGFYEIQSPQIFQRQALADAYAKRTTLGSSSSVLDDASLIRLNGGKVVTVPGSPYNLRVTSDEQLKLAADCLKHLPKPRKTGPITPFDEAQW